MLGICVGSRRILKRWHGDEFITIPADFDPARCGWSFLKARDVMIRLRPDTIGQANRLPGLTPAAVVAVLRHLRRQESDVPARQAAD